MTLAKDYGPLYDPITKNDVADYFFNYVTQTVIARLRNQAGMNNENLLLDLGDQIVYGCSIFWDEYVDVCKSWIACELEKIPEKFQWAMWQKWNVWYEDDVVEELDFKEDLINEIWEDVCRSAEEAYEDRKAEADESSDDEMDLEATEMTENKEDRPKE